MLKITATGNLTNDVELKMNETTGKPYAILRIASDRRYRDQEGNRLTDFISIKVRGPLAEFCAAYAWKGCKLAASGDFETITFSDDPARLPDQGYGGGASLPPAGRGGDRCRAEPGRV